MKKDSIDISTIALNNQKLDEISLVDSDGENDTNGDGTDKITGLNVPLVMINGYNVSHYLVSFTLDLNGFLPLVKFTFFCGDDIFISVNYPKDGDIVSIYLRSPGDFYKPIRMDFNILEVNSQPSSYYSNTGSDPDAQGANLKFTITGECRITGLYTNRIKSFKDMSSKDTLLEISQDLDLGFSTNESSTNDEMTWICPNYSYYDFINEVTLRSYKDDESSFFHSWIDPYYNLNFINLGTQFAYEEFPKIDAMIIPGYTTEGFKADAKKKHASTPEKTIVPLIITNNYDSGKNPFFVNGYTLTSRSGQTTNKMGYITNICFYDESSDSEPGEKYVNYDIESQTSDNIEAGDILQKGRARENIYKLEKRKDWAGILNTKKSDDDTGVHLNYIHSKYQNKINNEDVNKLTLEVEFNDFFPGIYKGQVVPVEIYVTTQGSRQKNTGEQNFMGDNKSSAPAKDQFLSGNYVVLGMSIYWNYMQRGMKQLLILGKRKWKVNSAGYIPKAYPISLSNKKL